LVKELEGRNLCNLVLPFLVVKGDKMGLQLQIQSRFDKMPKRVWEACVTSGYSDILEAIVMGNVVFEDETVDLNTLLLKNAREGNHHICSLLLDLGALPDAQRSGLDTPLGLAAFCNHLDICRVLVEYGAQLNSYKKPLWTPLTNAVHEGHLEVATYLIENGADVNFSLANGWVPITVAAVQGRLPMVKLLIENGADLSVRTKDGKSLMQIANEKRQVETATYLFSINKGDLESAQESSVE
jgi:ankyrin repeat protein